MIEISNHVSSTINTFFIICMMMYNILHDDVHRNKVFLALNDKKSNITCSFKIRLPRH